MASGSPPPGQDDSESHGTPLTQALIANYMPKILRIRRDLDSLAAEQERVLDQVHEDGAVLTQSQQQGELDEIRSTLQQLPLYIAKLQAIRGEMVNLTKQSRRLRERSSALHQKVREVTSQEEEIQARVSPNPDEQK